MANRHNDFHALPRLRIGEPFNPWRKVCGFYPPDVVGRQSDLTDGQKRLYERSVRWAGQNGTFWRGFQAMAEALGKSLRQVKNDMGTLEAKGLIRHTRRRRNSNIYTFLWHGIFEVQDDVIFEVQPTARESSPIKSCPVVSEKADNKRIPGSAPQEPRSEASSLVNEGYEDSPNKVPKEDSTSRSFRDQNATSADNSVKGWTQTELAGVRRRIVAFWGREPEEGFEVSVMLRARGASAAAVCDLLDRKFANKNLRIGGRFAPKKQNWFLTVIENEFTPGHLPEASTPVCNDELQERENLDSGIEAIELPDAPRSIVESELCSRCGGQALVRYTDGTIEGCGCRRNAAPRLQPVLAGAALRHSSAGGR